MKTWLAAYLFLIIVSSGLRGFAASLVDATFNPGGGVQGGIAETVVPLSNGKILLSGNFTSFAGQNHGYLVRLNENGSLDPSFNAAPGYWVRHVAVQVDGKIIIGGFFQYVEGQSRPRIARLNADGSLDQSFQVGTGFTGRIVPADPTEPFVFQLAIQPDGKILAVGNFTHYNDVPRSGIARLNPDGSLDSSFNPGSGFNSWGRAVRVLPDGKIVAAGWFENYNNQSANRMVRLFPNGERDASFNSFIGDKTAIYSMALLSNNQMIVVGHSINEQGLFHREMGRMNPDGTFDSSFTASTNEKTEDVLVQSDGKIIVGGYFTRANDQPRKGIARYFADGTLDPSFEATFDNFIWTLALDRNGKLLAAGGFNTVDGEQRRGIVRLLTGGSNQPGNQSPLGEITVPIPNSTFRAGTTITITAQASDPDGSVAKVRFFANSQVVGETTTAPYTVRWPSAPGGVYELRAEVTDNAGAVSTSEPMTITVRSINNVAPTVSFLSPTQNQQFAGPASIQINANAADADGRVAKVRYFSGTTLLGEATAAPFTFVWENVRLGEYDLKAEATDNQGAVATSSPVRVKVVTAPAEPPRLKTILKNGSNLQFAVSTQAGTSYQLQATTSMQNPDWQAVSTFNGTGQDVALSQPMSMPQRFFRVVRQ